MYTKTLEMTLLIATVVRDLNILLLSSPKAFYIMPFINKKSGERGISTVELTSLTNSVLLSHINRIKEESRLLCF